MVFWRDSNAVKSYLHVFFSLRPFGITPVRREDFIPYISAPQPVRVCNY